VVICGVGWGKSEEVRNACESIYASLKAQGVDVILDDRDLRPGIMFAEWELIGPPIRITVGDRGLKDGVVELLCRTETDAARVELADCVAQTIARLSQV
jgi:prolyl-tRNA synthetase